MSISSSLSPILAKDFGFFEARHLLNRAGFGGTPRQIKALEEMGGKRAVEFMVDYLKIDETEPRPRADADIIAPLPREERMMMRDARRNGDQAAMAEMRAMRRNRQAADRQQMEQLRRWWMARIISTPRPLEEKLVLLWHSHFASNQRTVRDSYLMYKQNMLFRKHAGGSFANLAAGIVRDPAMIRFLDNNRNHWRKPNENLARELMELFMLGEGHYTEHDIKQGARALTGYTFRDNDFFFAQRMHDDGEKTILGQTGTFDGDDFVRIILRQKDCAAFVCYKLYQHFVADVSGPLPPPARSVILQMARVLRAGEYRVPPLLKKLLRSRHFYDPHVVNNKIKSPIQLVAGTIRILQTPARDIGLLVDAASVMGQHLFDPPSVAGWSGGRSWINTSTLFVRQNLTTYLITGKLPNNGSRQDHAVDYDPMFLLDGLGERTAESVADHLMRTLLGEHVLPERRRRMVSFLSDRGEITRDRVIGLLLLITSMPEYQLC